MNDYLRNTPFLQPLIPPFGAVAVPKMVSSSNYRYSGTRINTDSQDKIHIRNHLTKSVEDPAAEDSRDQGAADCIEGAYGL